MGAAVRISADGISGRATGFALIATLTLAMSCSSARAQGNETWRCSAPNGHFDQNVLTIPADASSVSGQIIMHNADFSPDWNSVARISVKQRGTVASECHCNGISFYAFPDPSIVEYRMNANGESNAMAKSKFDVAVTFDIAISPEGLMTVKIGKTDPAVKTVALTKPEHNMLVMSCSGVDMEFLNVAVR